MYDEAATASHGPPEAESAATLRISAKESMFDIANDGIGIVANECVVAALQLEDCSVAKANASITALQVPSCNAAAAHSFVSIPMPLLAERRHFCGVAVSHHHTRLHRF